MASILLCFIILLSFASCAQSDRTSLPLTSRRRETKLRRSSGSVGTTRGDAFDTLEYVVTVGLGTPPVAKTLMVDTGSDVTWVQCAPCRIPPCHSQKDGFFNPNESSTYAAISCGSPACSQLRDSSCSGRQCQYGVAYGDQSTTRGAFGTDTLTLTPSDVLKNFQFGCSHGVSGFDDQTDGLLGLGGDQQSLVSQAAETYGKVFSYCLPPSPASSGFLTLGAPADRSRFVHTPMHGNPTLYRVQLEAITIDGRKLDVPADVFSPNVFVDSGTIVTQLPPTAYAALRAAFRGKMSGHKLGPANGILDTCYVGLGKSGPAAVPEIALVFGGGAVVSLHSSGILTEEACLAFAPLDSGLETGVIGNVQLRTFEVLVDVAGGAIGFRPGAC